MNKPILIIGRPHTGKTTFLTQLYAKLASPGSTLKLYKPVENISSIIESLRTISDGNEVSTTPTKNSTGLYLPIECNDQKVDMFCPDYGGEQINEILQHREVGDQWQQSIKNSKDWLLFIRVTNLQSIFDLSNKTISSEALPSQSAAMDLHTLSDQSALIELMQMILYIKGQDAHLRVTDTKLTIILTCWDEVGDAVIPINKLRQTLPLFYDFTSSNWEEDKLVVLGLSSLGLSLKENENKIKYQESGNEHFGFYITKEGEKINDISKLIEQILQ